MSILKIKFKKNNNFKKCFLMFYNILFHLKNIQKINK